MANTSVIVIPEGKICDYVDGKFRNDTPEECYHLITRYTYGAVIDEIDATHVSNIPIPLLKNHDIQKRINDLALEANQKRYEAYKLEQKALEIMDREVIYAK